MGQSVPFYVGDIPEGRVVCVECWFGRERRPGLQAGQAMVLAAAEGGCLSFPPPGCSTLAKAGVEDLGLRPPPPKAPAREV